MSINICVSVLLIIGLFSLIISFTNSKLLSICFWKNKAVYDKEGFTKMSRLCLKIYGISLTASTLIYILVERQTFIIYLGISIVIITNIISMIASSRYIR